MPPVVPLVVRSHYSLMRGTASVTELCRAARRMGYTRLALTDTDNLYGLWPFLSACRREGLKPLIGAEITDPKTGSRAVCLVEDSEGYRNLCRLLTRRHKTDSQAPFSLKARLPEAAKGLTILTCDVKLLEPLHEAGAHVAACMPRRPLSRTHPLCKAAKHLGIPLTAAPDSFFIQPEDIVLHQYLRAIDNNMTPDRLTSAESAPRDAWLAPPEVYAERFAPCPEALYQSNVIADRLTFTQPDFGRTMPPWHGSDAESTLREYTFSGARKRYGRELSGVIVARIEHELDIIYRMAYASYFLVVREIVKSSSRTCGRGSGAASIVAYCLGITNVCPVRYNLYFERFLNPDRRDPPDIDVDFAWDERNQVLEKVLMQYGHHAAMVCCHVTFKPRMAVRETAKVFGLPEIEIGRITRRIPWYLSSEGSDKTFFDRIKSLPGLNNHSFPSPWPEIFRIARRITGTPRYIGVHSGGVVITPRPVYEYVPVQQAVKGAPIVQWEKDAVEDAGLVKIDLLGNRSLGVIRDAIHNIRNNNESFEEAGWHPENDFKTQKVLAQGRTMGCFYVESPAMRQLQQKAASGDPEHLVIHSSIIRPAASVFIREYIRRLHGGAWKVIHPVLEDILKGTCGIMVYQEDVSRTAIALAGFTHAEADGLRKIMSGKDRELHLPDIGKRFFKGALANGLNQSQAASVWQMIMSFSGYSFCKAHSASYAQVSFQSAYLKVHFPAEFMAAVISNQGGFYSTFAYVSECRRLGLKILPPDVNQSHINWYGCAADVRVGLMSVKHLLSRTVKRIIQERRHGLFADLADFLRRVSPGDPEARALIHCGALDSLHPEQNRTALLWEYASWRRCNNQETSLFADNNPKFTEMPPIPLETELMKLRREFSILGFLCKCHPVRLFEARLKKYNTVKAAEMGSHVNRKVRFAGWLITGKTIHTQQNEPMQFLTFEDETDLLETTFFPETYRRYCHLIAPGRLFLLDGTVHQDFAALSLTVNRVEPVRECE